jgi:hypothetical protein
MGTLHKTSCVLCAQNCGLELGDRNILGKEDILPLKEKNHVKVI